jgi:hypothetical protein
MMSSDIRYPRNFKQLGRLIKQKKVVVLLRFTLRKIIALYQKTHGIEEPIKIIGHSDDWIIHTTHKHEQVRVVKLQTTKR